MSVREAESLAMEFANGVEPVLVKYEVKVVDSRSIPLSAKVAAPLTK